MNYQTPDDPMLQNKGRFKDNGGSGYVLKPNLLLDPNTKFNPTGPFDTTTKLKLKVCFH